MPGHRTTSNDEGIQMHRIGAERDNYANINETGRKDKMTEKLCKRSCGQQLVSVIRIGYIAKIPKYDNPNSMLQSPKGRHYHYCKSPAKKHIQARCHRPPKGRHSRDCVARIAENLQQTGIPEVLDKQEHNDKECKGIERAAT